MDYVCEMVTECQRKFPDVRFEHGDARDLSRYEDGSFYLVMFSLNGISMVDHQGRMKILKEVYRILAPGGSFLFQPTISIMANTRSCCISPTWISPGTL